MPNWPDAKIIELFVSRLPKDLHSLAASDLP